MTRHYCDRCGIEVTDQDSGAIHGVADANENGDGNTTDCYNHVCVVCYRAWKFWMRGPTPTRRPSPRKTR